MELRAKRELDGGRMSELNRDQSARDAIIDPDFVDGEEYPGGVRHYAGLDVERLDRLIREGFVDVRDAQNAAPTIEQIAAFMRRWPCALAHGYVVSAERSDYRLSVEGVSGRLPGHFNRETIAQFREHLDALFADGADDYRPPTWPKLRFYVWFD
jgi:hypothetical protein